MTKTKTNPLDSLTPSQLGALFPVTISDPDPSWPDLFLQESAKLVVLLESRNVLRIEHIGSTAVPDLKAKPTIDILLEVPDNIDTGWLVEKMANMEYHFIPRPENPAPHMMFVKGYFPEGFRGQAFHVHVRHYGDWDELYFRDYLIAHPDVAREYETLKVALANRNRNDRDGYTDKKTDFIKRVTALARRAVKTV